MLILLSPAKRLDFSPSPHDAAATEPRLGEETARLARAARRLTRADLKGLMHLSDDLATLNQRRFKAFDPDDGSGAPAALAFAGDVYQGLKARELDADALAWAQDRLRILSGLYGVLRPLDRIQPHRLEMGTRLKTRRGATLYDFWDDRVAQSLDADAARADDPTIVNLASQEYFGVVDRRTLKAPVVTCHFRETRDGEARIIPVFAKKARGLMARWAIDGRVDRAEDLKGFDVDGYRFDPAASREADWCFVRAQAISVAVAFVTAGG